MATLHFQSKAYGSIRDISGYNNQLVSVAGLALAVIGKVEGLLVAERTDFDAVLAAQGIDVAAFDSLVADLKTISQTIDTTLTEIVRKL